MSKSAELTVALDELIALLRRSRELLEPTLDGAALNNEALTEVDSLIDRIGPMIRQLQLLVLGLPAPEWKSLIADCRRGCPAAFVQFIDWLGAPLSEGESGLPIA
jgi:hypothetical protein